MLLRVHLWIGLTLCLPLAALGITGSLLVFEPELDRLLHPELHAASSGPQQPLAAIVAAAQAAAPSGFAPVLLALPRSPGDAMQLRFAPARREPAGMQGSLQVFIDPVSLAVLGRRDPQAGVLRRVFMLHANLLTGDRSGREVIGWLGVAMTALGISGIFLWWPGRSGWRRAVGVRRGARGWQLMRELHGTLGICGFAVLIAVSLSGVALAFPRPVAALMTADDPGAAGPRALPIDGATRLGIDDAAALALRSVAGGLRFVAFPSRPDQPFRIGVAPAGDTAGAPTVDVFVDPWRDAVVATRDPRAGTAGASLFAWRHSIHQGIGLGPVWRLAVFVVGLLPLLFTVTGSAMWLLARRARRGAVAMRAAVADPAE